VIRTRSFQSLLFIVIGLLGLGAATRASAATGGYPYADAVCSVRPQGDGSCSSSTWTLNGSSADPRGYVYRNCTSYVAWKLGQGGYTMPRGAGNANNWDDFFRARRVAVNGTPAVGAIAQTDAGDFGHVAYVEAVGNGTVTVSEYNVPFPYGTYHTRIVTANSFVYVHVHDIPPPTTTTPPRRQSDSTVTVRADFNGDSRSDVVLVTPRGPSGLNFVPLLSNGSTDFTHGGLWFNTGSDYTLDQVKLAAGDFNGDNKSDVLLVTPRGPTGPSYPAAQAAAAGYLAHAAHQLGLHGKDMPRWATSTLLGDFALDAGWRQVGHRVTTVRWQGGQMVPLATD
jgi:surface antigen